MARVDTSKGVSWYTTMTATISVHFPEDKVVCQYCPLCRNEDSLRRWKCLWSGEYLLYPFDTIGNRCIFAEQKGEEK